MLGVLYMHVSSDGYIVLPSRALRHALCNAMNVHLQLMSLGQRQWSLFDHDGKNLVENIRSGPKTRSITFQIKQAGNIHGRKLCICVISWSNLDDIRTDEVEAVKATDDGAELTGRPASSLGGTGCRCNYPWSEEECLTFCDRNSQAGSRVSMSMER